MAQDRTKNFGDKKHTFTDDDRKKAVRNREENRKQRKTYYEIASILSSQKWKPSDKDKLALKKYGLENEELNNQFLFVFSVFMSAAKGNANAMKMWLEMTSEYTKERERLEVEKLKAEIERLKAESTEATDVEDLSPLVALLMGDKTATETDETE